MYHLFLLYLLFLLPPYFLLVNILFSAPLLLSCERERALQLSGTLFPTTPHQQQVVSPIPGILTQPQLAAGQGNHVASVLQAAPLISHWSKQKSHKEKIPFISLRWSLQKACGGLQTGTSAPPQQIQLPPSQVSCTCGRGSLFNSHFKGLPLGLLPLSRRTVLREPNAGSSFKLTRYQWGWNPTVPV